MILRHLPFYYSGSRFRIPVSTQSIHRLFTFHIHLCSYLLLLLLLLCSYFLCTPSQEESAQQNQSTMSMMVELIDLCPSLTAVASAAGSQPNHNSAKSGEALFSFSKSTVTSVPSLLFLLFGVVASPPFDAKAPLWSSAWLARLTRLICVRPGTQLVWSVLSRDLLSYSSVAFQVARKPLQHAQLDSVW
eukprot:947757-Amphidinium_carterae.1